ncbi:MAG: TMEM175 family protein [Bacteroidota bacterium]
MSEKNLELERLVFFSDAVVAIAITLLALDLRIEKTASGHLLFSDLGGTLHKFAAFFLSFFIIAAFWKVHHEFFSLHKKDKQRFTVV